MPRCEFSEDQYEQNLLFELREVHGAGLPHFKPSRLIEPDVGFDFAVATDFFAYWRRGVFANDPRLQGLMPAHRRAHLSAAFVTAFVQCKVPMQLTRGRGAHAQHFRYWGRPVFRLALDAPQNNRLSNVEQSLGTDALVRYAAPCFHTLMDSDTYCFAGQTAARSHFVSPSRLAGHQHYTYLLPNQRGRAFSEPEDIEPEPFVVAVHQATRQAEQQPLGIYISRLWKGLSAAALRSEYDVDSDRFLAIAERLVPEIGDLPLDPFGLFREQPASLFPGDERGLSLRSYVAAIVGIEIMARDFLHASVRIFIKPSR